MKLNNKTKQNLSLTKTEWSAIKFALKAEMFACKESDPKAYLIYQNIVKQIDEKIETEVFRL